MTNGDEIKYFQSLNRRECKKKTANYDIIPFLFTFCFWFCLMFVSLVYESVVCVHLKETREEIYHVDPEMYLLRLVSVWKSFFGNYFIILCFYLTCSSKTDLIDLFSSPGKISNIFNEDAWSLVDSSSRIVWSRYSVPWNTVARVGGLCQNEEIQTNSSDENLTCNEVLSFECIDSYFFKGMFAVDDRSIWWC